MVDKKDLETLVSFWDDSWGGSGGE